MAQQNKYHVIVSARAAQMLVSHAAFLAQVSPAAAERLTVEFEKAAKSLKGCKVFGADAAALPMAQRRIHS